jgi:hypothetical protein
MTSPSKRQLETNSSPDVFRTSENDIVLTYFVLRAKLMAAMDYHRYVASYVVSIVEFNHVRELMYSTVARVRKKAIT